MGHLVLRRKVGERIKIGDDVEIKVMDCRNGCTEIAILAPKSIKIKKLPNHMDEEKEREHKARNKSR